MDEKLQSRSYVFLILSGLPLLMYPFVFLSVTIGMIESRPLDLPLWALLLSSSCKSVSLGYPCVYVPCAVGAITAARNKNLSKETKYAKWAFNYFLFVAGLLLVSSLILTS